MAKKAPDLDIIVPVLNEEKSVEKLIIRVHDALKSARIEYRLIFVDDHSSDATVKRILALKKSYPIVLLTKKGARGKAYSILEGARVASAKIVAMLDGDLQYPPEAIPEMFSLTKQHGVVVANRKKRSTSALRKFVSKFAAFAVAKVLLGFNCDAQSGLKVFKRKVIESITEEDVKPWALDMPLLHSALQMGESIGTVDINFSARKSGRSKVNLWKTSLEIILVALKLRFGTSKVAHISPVRGHKYKGAGVIHKSKTYITHTRLPHRKSALYTLVAWQKWFILSVFALVGIGLLLDSLTTLVILIAGLSLIYFSDVIFSSFVLLKSLHFPPELKFTDEELGAIDEKKLPLYTVLCPLYKESSVLPKFVESVSNLDWPKNKLEVLILLEEDDAETLEVAKSLKLAKYFKVIVVPDSQPRTKPKACNFGLSEARGEFTVVYDAEDRPEPSQLKKAYLGFLKSSNNVICLQSKLNYYNPEGNLLTRLFTAEYSLWFDVVLPGLQSIDSSIPLGGTSNHFRTQALADLHGWDPFNVTEDCDLGVRIFKSGFKTAIIDSITLEEANSSVKNWIRQRSRWIKGYIQTYLVHMRDPIAFFKAHGIHALIFQLIIGMRISFLFINPFLWLMTFLYFAFRSTVGPTIEALYPPVIFYIASFSLVVGNFMYIYNYMIGCAKRGQYGLIKYVLFIPLYWLLASRAALKAIHQLVVKPHFWEKTHHGLDQAKIAVPTFAFPKVSVVASGLSLVLAASVANLLNFITSAYLGRVLTPDEFGLVALMSSLLFIVQLGYGGIFQTMSHQTAYLSGKHKKLIGNLWTKVRPKVFFASIVFFLLWLMLIPVMPNFFNSATFVPFIVFSPIWVVLFLNSVDSGFIQGSGKYHYLAVIFSLEAFSKLALSFLLVNSDLREWVYAALPLSTFVNLAIGWKLAGRVSKNNQLTKPQEVKTSKDLTLSRKFLANSLLSQFAVISFLSLDLLFVKHFMSARDAGVYALLALSGRMVYLASSLLAQFILPIISRQSGEGELHKNAFKWSMLAVAAPALFVFLIVGPLGAFTLPLMFGERAREITSLSTTFAFSMVLFSLAAGIVTFHQARRQYVFVLAGVITAATQATLLLFFHSNLGQVVNSMLASSITFVLLSSIFHLNSTRMVILGSNFRDMWDLLWMKFNGKTPIEGKLRILILNWRDTKHVWAGGAEVYVHELARRWVKEGHKVTLFCGNDGKSKRNEEVGGVRVVRRGGFYTVYLWAFFYYIFRFRGRYDVVVDSENGVPFFTPLYSRVPKILIIYHVHQDIFQKHLSFPLSVVARFLEGKFVPLVYKNVQIVTISNSSKKGLVKLGVGNSKEMYVVNPGVDLKLLKPGPKAASPTISYLGRLKPYKSVDTLIKAAALLVKDLPSLKVKIAGFGESRLSLEKLVAKLGLSSNIEFLGKISENQKAKLLAQSWVFVQPSTMEGWGISVIEANACGTPVVASRVPGLLDSVKNPSTGYVVQAGNEKAFAEKIKKILTDEQLRNEFSKNSIEWAQSFDWNEKASEFMLVINKTVARANGSESYSIAETN